MGREPTKVLILDDDPIDREVFKQYLRESPDASFQFAECDSGRDAAERCREYNPDCILLDYNLPDTNGLEVLEALAGADGRPAYAIVMLTGLGNERLAVDAMNAGVMDYATKGATTAETLHRTIGNAVEKFRMHREIAVQQERYRTLLEAIPLMVWCSGPGGAIHFANARWDRYAGSRRLDWLDQVVPEDRAGVAERWSAAIESCGVFETEARFVRHDGQARWHLLRAVPLAEPGPVRTWLCTATDIAFQKNAQLALQQQQKVESIGLLAGGIAHDFNNLLVGIMGGTSFALEAVPRTHPAHPLLRNVLEASERAAQLIRQMLAYAGKGQFVIERIDLSNLLEGTAELARTMVPDCVRLCLDAAPGLPPIEGDSGQVRQVVMNLVVNALESIPEGESGSVGVRTFLREVSPVNPADDVWGQPIQPGTYVVLEVKDTGCGMTDETLFRMFDPFFSTKFTGRGLGLAAVQGIVRSNRGAIQVRSALGEGTVFRAFWPALQSDARRAPVDRFDKPATMGTLLVIDDEAVVRNIVQVTFGRAGYTVVTAESGRQGLQALETRSDISFVLLDMNMPGMTGRQVLQHLRKLRGDLPVIVCSGSNEDEVLREFDGLELAGSVLKPFTAKRLLEEVNAILERHESAQSVTAERGAIP